jgi:nucleotide-binding universal stress UspA family protein
MDSHLIDPRRHHRSCIVVGVDGSAASLRARAYATGLARRQNAELVAVYVHPTWTSTMMPEAAALAFPAPDELARELRNDAHVAALHFQHPIEFRVRTGDTATQLLQVAYELRANATVIGARRRRRWLPRPLAVRLLHSQQCPVILVP